MASYRINENGKRVLVHATQPPKPKAPAAGGQSGDRKTTTKSEVKGNG
jgi:hypothetical protein